MCRGECSVGLYRLYVARRNGAFVCVVVVVVSVLCFVVCESIARYVWFQSHLRCCVYDCLLYGNDSHFSFSPRLLFSSFHRPPTLHLCSDPLCGCCVLSSAATGCC